MGPNNCGKDQEGTGAERRNQEGPKGSNASSRQKQQDTSRSSVTDTAQLYMVAKMQMMKEWIDFIMNALRGQVSNDIAFYCTRHFIPYLAKVLYVVDRSLRRI